MKLLTKEEFKEWLFSTEFNRTIKGVQMHHTWKPNYDHWNDKPDPLYWCESMKRSHLKRGFSDIAQNITICPNGSIVICRDFNTTPAGIKGKNTGYLCIENIGDFDNDQMSDSQTESILYVTALLSMRFEFDISLDSVPYHTWYASYKSCPGERFFTGNEDAEGVFYPAIRKEIKRLKREDEAANI